VIDRERTATSTIAKPARMRRRIWIAAIVVVLLFGDQIASKLVFSYLCATQGGQSIYRSVDDVPGVIRRDEQLGCTGGCLLMLGKYKYGFVEIDDTTPDAKCLTQTTGVHRFYLANRGAAECALYEAAARESPEYVRTMQDRFFVDPRYCIAATKLERFTARYSYSAIWNHRYLGALGIGKREGRVTDERTSELLALSNLFQRANGWFASLWGTMGGGESCHSDDEDELVVRVLKPGARSVNVVP
jgi:hypothetical protein